MLQRRRRRAGRLVVDLLLGGQADVGDDERAVLAVE
jgi:hypothetical protein